MCELLNIFIGRRKKEVPQLYDEIYESLIYQSDILDSNSDSYGKDEKSSKDYQTIQLIPHSANILEILNRKK